MKINRLLERQIAKHLSSDLLKNKQISSFIESVNQSYIAFEKDKSFNDHIFKITQSEFSELKSKLNQEVEEKRNTIEKLVESIKIFENDNFQSDDLNDVTSFIKNHFEKSESLIAATINKNSESSVLMEDEKGKIIYVSNRFLKMNNSIPQKSFILGQKIENLVSQLTFLDDNNSKLQKKLKEIKSKKEETVIDLINTSENEYYELKYLPTYKGSSFSGNLWVFTNVTERKKTEIAQKEKEDFQDIILRNSLDAVIIISEEGKIVNWDKKAEALFGWSEKEVLNKTLDYCIMPKVHSNLHKRGIAHYLKTGEHNILGKTIEVPAIKKDNTEIIISLIVSSVKRKNETQFISFIRDITELKKLEDELNKQRTFNQEILDNLPTDVAVFDVDHKYLFLNKAAIKDDYIRSWIIGKDDFEYARFKNKDTSFAHRRRDFFQRVLKYKQKVRWEEEIINPDHSKSTILRILNPVIENKTIKYVIGYAVDITELKREQIQSQVKEILLTGITQVTNEILTNKNIEKALSKSLKYIGKATNVDRVYIFKSHQGEKGDKLVSQNYEWTKNDISVQINNPDLQNIPYQVFGDLFDDLINGNNFNAIVKNIVDPNLRSLLEAQEIISILIVPILINKKLWGFIGFDDCQNEREWSKTETNLLKALAATIGKAIINSNNEKELLKINKSFQSIFDAFPDLFFRINRFGDIIEQKSSTTLKEVNLFSHNLEGKNLYTLLPKEISEKVSSAISNSLVLNKLSSFEFELQNDKKILKNYECRILPQSKDEFVAIIRDISALKKLEKETQEGKKVLEGIHNALTEFVFWSIDVQQDKYLYVSKSAVSIYGSAYESFLNDTKIWINSAHPDDKVIVDKMYQNLLNGQETKAEYRIIDSNGKIKHIESIVKPHKNEDGVVQIFDGITRNISEKKELELELDNQRLFTENILNNLPTDVSVINDDKKYLFINKHAIPNEDLRSRMIGKDDFEYAKQTQSDKQLAQTRNQILDKVLSTRNSFEFIENILIKEKHYSILRNYYPVLNNGKIDFIISYGTDITAIVESERKSKLLIESSPDIIQSIDEKGNIIFVNDIWLETLGYSNEEVVGKNIFDFIAPQSLSHCQVMFSDIMQSGTGKHDVDVEFATKEGVVVYTRGNVTVFYENNRLVTNAFFKDITIEKQKSEEILNQKYFFENILDSLPTEIFVVNRKKEITYLNEAFLSNKRISKKLLGKKIDENISLTETKLKHVLKYTDLIDSAFLEKKESSWEDNVISNNGNEKYFFRKLIPFTNENEEFVLLSSNNISDLVLAKKEIDRINEGLELTVAERTLQLENSIKELDSFSYSVSHDLRSPLRAIDGWSLALIEDYGDELDETAQGYINRMRDESKRMGNLIDDLLNLSKIGKKQIIRKQINFTDFCLQILKRIVELEKYKYPEINIQDNLFVNADENLLDILITNLLSNALKFSSKKENPKIEIGTELIDNIPFYYIKDNGAGFEMKNAGKLFGAFQRMHRQSDFSGTGIGLATVKRIVNLHGGTIFADSKVNEGTTFYFNLDTYNYGKKNTISRR